LREKFSGCEDFKIVTIHGLGYKAVIKWIDLKVFLKRKKQARK
jgi:hypothetical protein